MRIKIIYKFFTVYMKFYETSFEEYIHSVENYNMHPELNRTVNLFPSDVSKFGNMIVYGPPGAGKYSQVLNIIKRYSGSSLKYEKKMIATTDKQEYKYKISDIHYEIDMALLGCNSKIIWHELFYQIVDIISVKSNKTGFILCKNFHLIHSELLEIFYSYIQQYNHSESNISIHFIILTEHISFIPNQILNVCQVLNIGKPSKDKYQQIAIQNIHSYDSPYTIEDVMKRFATTRNINNQTKKKNIIAFMKSTDMRGLINAKELKSFDLLFSDNSQIQGLPNDNFNIICNKIIEYIIIDKNIPFLDIRDSLYDILTYNLDVVECIWYIFCYLIKSDYLNEEDISDICMQIFFYLKYFNNNYRPIYHLESFFYYISIKVHEKNEL